MDFRVRRSSVKDLATNKLRESIMTGVFKPGDRLIESELCEMLGVSRPSVREALSSLEAERLISSSPNRGTEIPVISWRQAREIYQVRALLEGEAAALFAVRARPEQLSVMNQALEAFSAAIEAGDGPGLLRETTKFYEVLVGECGNSVIVELLRGLLARISLLRDRSMSTPGRAICSLAEMQEILEAAKHGDPGWARQAAVAHVDKACEAARESYREREAE